MDRREMAEVLDQHIRSVNVYFDREEQFPAGKGPLKTYILEVHPIDGEGSGRHPVEELLEAVSSKTGLTFDSTKDQTLLRGTKGDSGFFFDLLNPRFWIVHTMSNIEFCQPVLDMLVGQFYNFDYAWLPSQMMRKTQSEGKALGFTIDFDETEFLPPEEADSINEPNATVKIHHRGTGADVWLRNLSTFAGRAMAFSMVRFSVQDPTTDSYLISELNYWGRFKAAGNSISLHLACVASLLKTYSNYIESIEARFRLRPNDGEDGIIDGDPIVIDFPAPIRSFEFFVDRLFSSGEPLRIWGIPEWIRKDFVRAEGVDLHSGSRLGFDITPEYLRLYLHRNSCGNSVARLLRNLQAHLDSNLLLPPVESGKKQ